MASVKFKKKLTKAQYDALETKEAGALYFLEGETTSPDTSNVKLMLDGKDYSGIKKIETGTTAGTIKVDGVEVAVKDVGDVTTKADKVTGATNGNFAGLDSNGNLTDSGSKAADFATAAQGAEADTAVQSVKIGTGSELKSGTNVVLPTSYPSAEKVDHKLTVGEKEFDGSAAVTIAKADLGLGNVTNDAQVKRSEMGVASGVATLDASGKVPSTQLPSYVDDVIEGYFYNDAFYEDATHETAITGETGKIYVDITSGATPANKSYRYSGSAYIEIVASPGTTDNVTEGSTNLYYTDTRADARVAAGIEALDATVTSSNGTNVQVQVVEADGVITGVNVSTDNTINATDLATAINALDATPAQTAGTDGLALSLTQADGVVTAISGSIAANTYDAYGSAAAVAAMLEWD